MTVCVSFAKPPGLATLLESLERAGATHAGSVASPRVPIDVLRADDALRFAGIFAATAADWTAEVSSFPLQGVWIKLDAPDRDRGRALLDQLVKVGDIEIAISSESGCNPPGLYWRQGASHLGDCTVIGPRLAGLMEPAALATLTAAGTRRGELLVIDAPADAELESLQRAFRESGVAAQVGPAPLFIQKPGPRWAPPPAAPDPASPSPAHKKIIDALRHTMESGNPVKKLEAEGLVAPFSILATVKAAQLELEGARLAFSDFTGSELDDAGFVGADLRGIAAANVHWVEVSLVEADLRWASFRDADLPGAILDRAKCEGIDLTNARGVETAEGASFDDAIATAFAPLPDSRLSTSTFRRAKLDKADFTGANLENAVFDGADLTGAVFHNAKLRGASFRGCILDGATFDGANRDEASFD